MNDWLVGRVAKPMDVMDVVALGRDQRRGRVYNTRVEKADKADRSNRKQSKRPYRQTREEGKGPTRGTLVVWLIERSSLDWKRIGWVGTKVAQEVWVAGSKFLRLKRMPGLELTGVLLELFLLDIMRMHMGLWQVVHMMMALHV